MNRKVSNILSIPTVLIVGAGPSGLALASFLALAKIPFRIIDKNPSRSDKSKALGVQAGTLEAIDSALGPELSRQMMSAGWEAKKMFAHIESNAPLVVPIGSFIPSRYDFILILEQSETERIFEEFLERHFISIERNTELVTFEQSDGKVLSRLKGPQGIESVESQFIVGCDGAHSTVRHLLDMPFEGKAYTGNFILGDVTLDWNFGYGDIRNFVSDRGAMVCFPMRGEKKYRLILIPKYQSASDSLTIGLDEFSEIAASLFPTRTSHFKIADPTWLTRFRVQQRMTTHYRHDHAFLVGDAAHIHNPAGGQGMNTGIQDAFNLGDKLVRYLKGSREALDQYEIERLPIAKRVLRGTDVVFKLALLKNRWLSRVLIRYVLPRVLTLTWIQRRVVEAVSQVQVARREIRQRSY